MKFIEGEKMPLGALRSGSLFKSGDTIALKTDYYNELGYSECYILGSGDFFYGGIYDPSEHEAQEVIELKLWE